jgi:hypothetical protein
VGLRSMRPSPADVECGHAGRGRHRHPRTVPGLELLSNVPEQKGFACRIGVSHEWATVEYRGNTSPCKFSPVPAGPVMKLLAPPSTRVAISRCVAVSSCKCTFGTLALAAVVAAAAAAAGAAPNAGGAANVREVLGATTENKLAGTAAGRFP